MTTITINPEKTRSTASQWIGKILSILCVLFLIVDAGMKIILNPIATDASQQLGWSADKLIPVGSILLVCTILYSIPRTAIVGAIALTGYLGGAIATMYRIDQPFYFPLVFGALLWIGLLLRDDNVKQIFKFRR